MGSPPGVLANRVPFDPQTHLALAWPLGKTGNGGQAHHMSSSFPSGGGVALSNQDVARGA